MTVSRPQLHCCPRSFNPMGMGVARLFRPSIVGIICNNRKILCRLGSLRLSRRSYEQILETHH